MGWTSGDGGRQQVVREFKATRTSKTTGTTWETLKHHAAPAEDWFQVRQTKADGSVYRYILVMIWDGDAHKELSEAEGPYYYGCPVAWLDEVVEPQTPHAAAWRNKVRSRRAA